MTEGLMISAPESSDDDDSESPAPAERRATAPRTHEVNQAKLGELLFGRNKPEMAQKPPEHFFEREKPEAQKSPLFAAIAEKAAEATIEKSLEKPDDDDDEEEPKSKRGENAKEQITEAADAEAAPDDHLSEDEKRVVVKAERTEHQAEIEAERQAVTSESPDDVALAAVETFNDKLDERLNDPDAPVAESIEQAAAETLAEVRAITGAEGSPEDTGPENDTETVEPPDASSVPTAEVLDDEPDDNDAAPVPTVTGGAGGSSTPPPSSGGSWSSSSFGSGGVPPSWITRFGAGGGSPPGGPSGGLGSAGYNAAPVLSGPSPEDLLTAERRGQRRGLIAGGILGYLIGRRRGRLKTEAKLLPAQKKLEQEVKQLHTTVAGKEDDIRRLTRRQAETASLAMRQKAIERLRPASKISPEAPYAPGLPPEAVSAPFTLENQPLPITKPVAENLPLRDRFRTAEAPPPTQHIEHVERMNQQELLAASEKVIIEGASLRAIYEARQITEPGLRHILTEFMSGGDIKKALTQELAVKQTAYERDPYLRDNLSAGYGQGGSGGGGAAAGLTQDQLSIAQGQQIMQQTAELPALKRPEQSDIPTEAARSAKRLETMIISGWVVTVVILVIIAVILLARR